MSKIVDNEDLSLRDALSAVLPHANAFDACVGYFNLRGWRLLREAIGTMRRPTPEGRKQVRLLVGMAVPIEDTVRQAVEGGQQAVDMSTAVNRADQAVLGFARQLTWGVPSKAEVAGLRQLQTDLADGLLQVKFVAREPLHAKLYITHEAAGMQNRRAIVGSSNFTAAGLVKQGELSLEETDQQVAEELSEWFEARWDDYFSVDITRELERVLEESFIRLEQPSPYYVYLRLAFELSRDAREGVTLDIPPEVKKVLLPHQISAVQVATRLLERKGIAVIGDVVGLGKTLTGTAIAATVGESVLVIAPKNLVKMWEEHLYRFHIPGKVISLSMVHRELPDLRRYRIVLIDESHNLRNRLRKAWDAIHAYVAENDSKVVLLTATMFNARHKDIGGQLGLKLDWDEPLGIRPDKHIAELDAIKGPGKGAQEVAKKTGGRLDSLAAFDQSEHNEDWQRLLSEFLVRRTRKFLEATYGRKDERTGEVNLQFPDGTTFRFPKRVAEGLKYPGGAKDPNDALATEDTFNAVENLTYARYQLGRYLKEDIVGEDRAEKELIADLEKSIQAAAGFIRTTALKRLTSSAHAFILTVKRMIARNAVLEHALSKNLRIPLGNFADQYFDLDDVDYDVDTDDELADAASAAWGIRWTAQQWLDYAEGAYKELSARKPAGIRWARPELFKKDLLLRNIREDCDILQDLLDSNGVWRPEDDSKLKALAGLINGLPVGEKVLVFSEYKDTVDYIAEHLPLWTKRSIASASGQSGDAVKVARRFAPKANDHLGGLPTGETEVDVLVTTDVLSEGQNLQDSAIVVNWDLPWTIIKVIQRAGRVDRVGQRADTIRVISFLPQEGVEAIIKLRERLQKRLKNAHQILGGGEQFFEDDDFTIDVSGLFNGKANLSEDEGEVDASSYALGIWDKAAPQDREIAKTLEDLVYSTKAIDLEGLPSAITYGRTDAGTDLLIRTTSAETKLLTPMEALKATESVYAEAAAEALSDQFTLMQRAADMMTEQVKQNTVLLNHGLRKQLYDFLKRQVDRIDIVTITRARLSELIDAVNASPIRETAKKDVVGILRAARVLGDPDDLIDRLLMMNDDKVLLDVRDFGADRVQVVTSMGFNPVGPTEEVDPWRQG
ncbi:helicase-related protein [Microbacterium sp. SS28]|uniref:helicase-related protein n=1 Tax=Microbacterium sp. SS28 TaxID=2919948 RepID=UPI001FAA8CC0|nr:helicase-related protein [Microbacterium sp. SS28]